jgi:Secretion system C-terminal sorting domain
MKTPIQTHYQITFKDKLTFLYLLFSFIISPNIFAQMAWESVNVPDSINIKSFVVDSSGTYYIGAGGVSAPNTHPFYGIYKSIDKGENWNNCGFKDTLITALEIAENGTILAVAGKSIYTSIDEGITWALLTNSGPGKILDILIRNNDTIFACGWNGVIRSFNRGIEWDTVAFLEGVELVRDICFDNFNNVVYGEIDYLSGNGGIYLSDNWGETWTKILSEDITSLAVDSRNTIYATTQLLGMFQSSDLGSSWYNTFFGVKDIMSVLIAENNVVYVGCEQYYDTFGGVYTSFDLGENWVEENTGLLNERVDLMCQDPLGFLYAIYEHDDYEPKLHRSQTSVFINESAIESHSSLLMVYPNPLQNSNTLCIENQNKAIERIEMYSGNGSLVVYSKEIEMAKTEMVISLPKLKVGLYILLIKFEDGDVA